MARPTSTDSGDDSGFPVDEIRAALESNMHAGIGRLIEMADAAVSLAGT